MSREKLLPLPVEEAFRRMNLSTPAKGLAERLSSVNVESHLIQDFVPLSESLEWELSQLHWDSEGLLPFVENSVPFVVNNSGRLSIQAAIVLFKYCETAKPTGDIHLLEMGAGTGLFARYLLDSFQDLCNQQQKNHYDRIRYYVTDHSLTTVKQWHERGVYEKHGGHVTLATCDGLKPGEVTTIDRQVLKLADIDAVFCNYMLDILPSAALRKKDSQLQELYVRTNLNKKNPSLCEMTDLSFDEIKSLLSTNDPGTRKKLVPLIDMLEHESDYRDLSTQVAHYRPILDAMKLQNGKCLFNYGAIKSLEQCLEMLAPSGFVLINDYGPSSQSEVQQFGPAQRFGSTVANGLNFPLLENYFRKDGCQFLAPADNADAPLQSRLLTRKDNQAVTACFLEQFGKLNRERHEGGLLEARIHQSAGRRKEALEAYLLALTHHQRDWYVLGEIAEFLIQQLQDFKAGVEVAQHAVQLNPWYSSWLWNVLGDGLYCLEQFKESHEAYLQAERIDPKDPRTNLDLAYTYLQQGSYEKALAAVAMGLTHDTRSLFRERLLEKQQQILAAISGKWLSRQERLQRRIERLS